MFEEKQRLPKPHLWLIRIIGVIVPRRLRADWRQEWEAELRYRERLLAEWDKLDWRNKLDLLRRSLGALWDALLLQPRRLEDEMFQDLRYGVRMLLKHPGFTAVAIMTLALGIGANTAMFSIVDALLLRPPAHVLDADQLVRVYPKGEWQTENRSFSDYADLRDGTHSFSELAAYQEGVLRATGRGPEAMEIAGSRVTASFFTLCGVKPALGRFFTAEEDRTPNVASSVTTELLQSLERPRLKGTWAR